MDMAEGIIPVTTTSSSIEPSVSSGEDRSCLCGGHEAAAIIRAGRTSACQGR